MGDTNLSSKMPWDREDAHNMQLPQMGAPLQLEFWGLRRIYGLEIWLHLEHAGIQIFTRMIGEGRRRNRGREYR